MSYLKRHRPICTVLQEIQDEAQQTDSLESRNRIIMLCREATTYAQRMSAKLTEYKDKENKDGKGK